MKKIFQWKHKLVGIILLVATVILTVSFFIVYELFSDKLEKSNFQTTTMSFEQTEKEINRKLTNASNEANKYLFNSAVDKFINREYTSDADLSYILRNIIWSFSETISLNPDLFGMAVISYDGHVAGATSQSKTIHTNIPTDNEVWEYIKSSASVYPFYTWIGSASVSDTIKKTQDGLSSLTTEPVLLGIRAIDYAYGDKTSYLLVAVRESAIQSCYVDAQYLQSETLMVDKEGNVISSINPDFYKAKCPYFSNISLGKDSGSIMWRDENHEKYQIVYYTIPSKQWRLINQIPDTSYKNSKNQIMLLIVIVLIATLVLLSLFFNFWIQKYTRPIDRLIKRMKKVAVGDLSPIPSVVTGINELDQLESQFATTVEQLSTLLAQLQQAEDEKREEELRTLQYQINPHFLYNSLNSIRWMAALNGNEKVADSITQLSKIIVPIMRSPSFYWTVAEEIDFVDGYIKMMILRFGGLMEYALECEDKLYEERFPRFILQPVIENCFTHGNSGENKLKIKITIKKEGQAFDIAVSNSGENITPERLDELNQELSQRSFKRTEGKSIGLPNVNKRLFLLYGENAKMWAESSPGIDTVIHLFFQEKDE